MGFGALLRAAEGADCVFSMRLSMTPAAIRIASGLGVPVVTYLHGYTSDTSKYERYRIDRTDAVLAVSQVAMSCYERAYPAERSDQARAVVHNGIDLERFERRSTAFDQRAASGDCFACRIGAW